MSSKQRIPIARPDLTWRETEAVKECVHSGWITQGPYVEKAEHQLKEITGRRYALCCSSGTSALIVALLAVERDWRPWIVGAPALIFAAVHNAIALVADHVQYFGADLDSWQTDGREMFDEHVCDSLILAPCYGSLGTSAAGTVKRTASGRITAAIVEDACESFGGSLKGKPAGSFGYISCLSFYANKICVSGEGGAVLTDDEALAKKMRTIINHGIEGKSYKSKMVGINGRMTDVQAAILSVQLDRMPAMLELRREIMARYREAAKGHWRLPVVAEGEIPAPWLFAGIPDDRSGVISRCEEANIEWRPFFPIPKDAPSSKSLQVARILSSHGICLPVSSAMTEEEVERVAEVIRG